MDELHQRIACYLHHESISSGLKLSAELASDKWCRISTTSEFGGQRTIHRFVALVDLATKGLGEVKAGNVHRTESWRMPHKVVVASVYHPDYAPENNPDAPIIDLVKKTPKPRSHMLATTIVNEIVREIGIPKARLHARWDGDTLHVWLTDAHDGEVEKARTYLTLHKDRFGITSYRSDYDDERHDRVHVTSLGEHDPDLLDTHEAIAALDKMRA